MLASSKTDTSCGRYLDEDGHFSSVQMPLLWRSPQQESIDHILCNGELATMVWNYFVGLLGMRLPQFRRWHVILNVWWTRAVSSSQAGCCRGILPIIIMWSLWRDLCENLMEGGKLKWRGMVHRVKRTLMVVFSPPRFYKKLHRDKIIILQELQCPITQVFIRKPI